MARPTIFHGNLLAGATLSGSVSGFDQPVDRLADGSASLFHPISGGVRARGDLGASPETARWLILPRLRNASGTFVTVKSLSGDPPLDAVSGTRHHGTFLLSGAGPETHELVSAGMKASYTGGQLLPTAIDAAWTADTLDAGRATPARFWRLEFDSLPALHDWTEVREFLGASSVGLGVIDDGDLSSVTEASGTLLVLRSGLGGAGNIGARDTAWHFQGALRPVEWTQGFGFMFAWRTAADSSAAMTSGAFYIRSPGSGEYRWVLGKAAASGEMTLPSGSAVGELVNVTLPLASAAVSGASGFTATEWGFEIDQTWALAGGFHVGRISGGILAAASGEAAEAMLGSGLSFARLPQVGVGRGVIQQRARIEMGGGEPFHVRYSNDLRELRYQLITTQAETASGIEDFIRANDAGQFFVFRDDLGNTFWAELPEGEQTYRDDAGVWGYELFIREVVLD